MMMTDAARLDDFLHLLSSIGIITEQQAGFVLPGEEE